MKKVFISYAWEDETYSKKVLDFSNMLRSKGIDAIIDQYEENPDCGWPIWMEQQIENADFVIVISTKVYNDKFNQLIEGKGVTWEISSIYQSLYNLQGHNSKFIPVIWEDNDRKYIPKALQLYTSYIISGDCVKLINRIKGIPNVVKPPVSEETPLPAKEAKTLFVSSPIDLPLWDSAQWRGVGFIQIPNHGCVIALVFHGDKQAARRIFAQWKKLKNIDDYIKLDFIEGDIEGLPKNGYTCLISPNINSFLERHCCVDGSMLLTISRFQRMYPQDNFRLFNRFKALHFKDKTAPVPIIPLCLIDPNKGFTQENCIPYFDEMIFLRNVDYLQAKDIKPTDIASCVVPKYNKDFPKEWGK